MTSAPLTVVVDGAAIPASCRSATISALSRSSSPSAATKRKQTMFSVTGASQPQIGLTLDSGSEIGGQVAGLLHHRADPIGSIGQQRHPYLQRAEAARQVGAQVAGPDAAAGEATLLPPQIGGVGAERLQLPRRIAHDDAAGVVGNLRPFVEIERDRVRPFDTAQQRPQPPAPAPQSLRTPRLRGTTHAWTPRHPPARRDRRSPRCRPCRPCRRSGTAAAPCRAVRASRACNASTRIRPWSSHGIIRSASRPSPAMSIARGRQPCAAADV